jgi:hypothetical protein
MSKKREKITAELCKKFNTVCNTHVNRKFKRNELIELFKNEFSITVDSVWLSKLIQYNVITAEGSTNDKYYTFSKGPILINKLQNVHQEVINTWAYYNRNNPKSAMTIESAIKLLKDNGYKVLKPKTSYEEV